MPTNDFLPFGTAAGANVQDQADYAANGAVGSGYTAGIAQSVMCNKTWRQGTFVAAAVAQFLLEQLNTDILDNGNLEGFVTNLRAALTTLQPRQVIAAPTTNFYVNSVTGNDTNNGTTAVAAGSGVGPWQTIQHAANFVVNKLDFNGQQVIINLAPGTYSPFIQTGNPIGCFGPTNLLYLGSVANPASVVISSTAAATSAVTLSFAAQATIQGVTLQTSGAADHFSHCLFATAGAFIAVQNVIFGQSAAAHCAMSSGGQIRPQGPYTISGSAVNHYQVNQGGSVATLGEVTPAFPTPFAITVTGSPTFTNFASVSGGATISIVPAVLTAFSGAAIGPRYAVNGCGVINVNGGGTSFFPGSAAGTVDSSTYGVYFP